MAIEKTELFSSAAGLSSGKRIWPETVLPRQFTTGSGTLAKGTVVAMITASGKYVAWDQSGSDGSQTIVGIIYPDAVELDASNEVIGQVMLQGKAHYADLVNPDGAASAAQFKAALRAAHSFGLIVEGIGV